MPFFYWKGIKSTDMGLVVESLPPVTRPAVRVEMVEIDGKDGDEVIELGYEAYDKTIVFGVKDTGENHLNEVTGWLTGEGSLITSAEPTKRYECKIIEGIDLERLARFRKGSVKLHTQPYKYAAEEAPVIWQGAEKRVSVTNQGNAQAAPIMTIMGTGTINVSVDGSFVFRLDLNENDTVMVDSQVLEAYDTVSLRNRAMTGDFVLLPPGGHIISWDGGLTALSVNVGSRWL